VNLRIELMNAEAASAIGRWRHPPPYDTYDFHAGEERALLIAEYCYHRVLDGEELVGYCCFGDEGRVPGGVYTDDALDMGWGMRPDLNGKGLGQEFATEVVAFAREAYHPRMMRVTIADFNVRSQIVAARVGFSVERERFTSASGMDYTVWVTEAVSGT
jgi:RimJ/RimL family protein N-acetyltransferase